MGQSDLTAHRLCHNEVRAASASMGQFDFAAHRRCQQKKMRTICCKKMKWHQHLEPDEVTPKLHTACRYASS
eukprot:7274435-Karenia_brevis.AAC.1